MFTLAEIKDHMTAMGHGNTLGKVKNPLAMFERASMSLLLKMHPLDVMRTMGLTNTVHDDEYNYSLPADFGSLIDLSPQDNRQSWDKAYRTPAGQFDLQKAIKDKTVSIEGGEGSKIIRINWRSRQGKTLNAMDSLTANGTWSAVASATGLKANTIFKRSGNASIEFDLVTTGDGIENTSMSQLDLTDEDEVADVFVPIYFSVVPTSVTGYWGNIFSGLSPRFWTSTAQTTQADGTAFRVGWNILKFPWSTATESALAVDPTTIDCFKITVVSSVAIPNIRVDNIIFSIGRPFEVKYYSKYIFRNTAGVWISRPTEDDDSVMLDNDSLPHFLYESLKAMAQQMEGTDSAFDISFAEKELAVIFPAYKGLNPGMSKKSVAQYGAKNPGRGRW